jgi:tetratricopeptide (TPR) repeat protein
MILSLQYNSHLHLPTKATFIRGGNTNTWLQEINRWQIAIDTLDCYVMPISIKSIEPSGLFVVFNDVTSITQIAFLEPFTCIGSNVYIPVNAEIVPQITQIELKALLLWDVQVLHPSIGMVGFETSNKLNLEMLFAYNEHIESDWSFANPGIENKPAFNSINIIPPTAEELINDIKKDIGQKPLSDIPKTEKDTPAIIDKLIDPIKYGLFKTTYELTSLVQKILPQASDSSNTSNNDGMLQQLQNWLLENIDELDKKRNDEITRLMNLFNDNSDEALQYAIPLDSPYFNRGSQTVSTKLGRRSTNFNLGGLGGGNVSDVWDLGDRYNDLRSKYLSTAQKEIHLKNYKKAAYVYAHLLGDFSSAANVLMQGNMHREAAALYKDHLKNIPAAAECLEKGGLYIEAIELYKELNKTEKVGDLYKALDQPIQASLYYEQHIEKQLSNNDYLDAARVMEEKMEQTTRAEDTLLLGWVNTFQHEACLKKYFDLVLTTNNDTTEQKVKQVYTKHTAKHKKIAFLNVLEHVTKRKKDASFTATAQEMAYEIVHEETEVGNLQLLNSLKKFLPDDKLISSDTSKYISNMQKRPTSTNKNQSFYLDQSIAWKKAVWHRNQFLVLGIKNNCLHMARGNWYKNIEYYSWTNEVKPYTMFTFVNAPYYSNHIIIHSSSGIPITRKNLPKNKYFTDALVVNCPIWLHKSAAQFLLDEEGYISKLEIVNGDTTLHQYTIDGDLKKSINCEFRNQIASFGSVSTNPIMINRNGYFYSYKEKQVFSVSPEGLIDTIPLDTIIRFIACTNAPSDLYIIVSTNKGCLLCKPDTLDINIITDYFATDLIPKSIAFIDVNTFVIIESNSAHIFKLIYDEPLLSKEIQTSDSIIAALPTNNQQEFALIEADGRITINTL